MLPSFFFVNFYFLLNFAPSIFENLYFDLDFDFGFGFHIDTSYYHNYHKDFVYWIFL